jgi:MFS family permease
MNRIPVREEPWTLKQAMATRPFWFMLFCMVVAAMVNTGITFHIVSIIATKGYSSAFAALILSIAAFVQFPLTFLAGYVVDRVKVRYVKSIGFGVLLAAMVMLLYSESKSALILFAVVHGIFIVFDNVSSGVLWPNYFGRKNLGSIRGIAMTAMVVGSALGPLPFGYAFDRFQGYREILLIMMVFPVLASLASFFSPVPDFPVETALEESTG